MRSHLAQAFSNLASRGRKYDFKDAERLVRRQIANELIFSFVPNGERRIWRSMTRMKLQLTRDRYRLTGREKAWNVALLLCLISGLIQNVSILHFPQPSC